MAGKVEICGVNTAKLPLYKEAEMTEMLIRIKEGDREIRDEFIKGNLRLVLSVIQRFSNRGENPDDLFQVGCIGLIKALDNFDMSHGVKFSTYAVPTAIECRENVICVVILPFTGKIATFLYASLFIR